MFCMCAERDGAALASSKLVREVANNLRDLMDAKPAGIGDIHLGAALSVMDKHEKLNLLTTELKRSKHVVNCLRHLRDF